MKYTQEAIGSFVEMSDSWVNKYINSTARITTQPVISNLSRILGVNGAELRKMEGKELIKYIVRCMDKRGADESSEERELRELEFKLESFKQMMSHSSMNEEAERKILDMETSIAYLKDQVFAAGGAA